MVGGVHWQRMYETRLPTEVGWYEPDPAVSRRLVEEAVERGAASVIDVGGGASLLVDRLLELDLERVAVLDVAAVGLALARERLAEQAAQVEWIVGDVTALENVGQFDVWHDRAVFHFLVDADARRRYLELLGRTLNAGGRAIIATFAPDGPERCSGLPVRRYSAQSLADELGPDWALLHSERHLHMTPAGVPQQYQYSVFTR